MSATGTGVAAGGPREPRCPGEWPLRGSRGLLLWGGGVAVLGLLLFTYHYLGQLAERQPVPPLRPFINELTGAFAVGLLFFPLRELVRRLPLTRSRWPYRLPLYLLAILASGAAATTVMWGLRALLYPAAGLGPFDYGVMPLRYLMELPMQVIAFTVAVAALHAYAALAAARARELRAVQLESSLARAQLQNLRLQLQPHFLFNALHTISSAMYEDPVAADEMLDQLAELLRASLRTAQTDEVPLADELALLAPYLALQRARFGDRLAVSFEVEPEAMTALLPSLLLQPLVENAIRHGHAERDGKGAVTVRARRLDETLALEVEDDGPGDRRPPREESPDLAGHRSAREPVARPRSAAPNARSPHRRIFPASGLGLATTAERLQLLYGEHQSFDAANAPGGGFLVRIALPFHRETGTEA